MANTFQHFSTPGTGTLPTVGKEMHFLIMISEIRAQIFKAVGKGSAVSFWEKKYIIKGVLCVTFSHIFAGSAGHLFSFITCPVAK